VDILGADGYNWYRCPGRNDPWTSFHDVFTGFYSYGVGKGKPMFVYEWGSNEDSITPGRKGQWITDAAVTLKTWPQVKAVAYYHNGPPAPICPWWVDSSPSSLAAFQGMGADAFFNPPRAPPAPTSVSAYVSVLDSSFGTPVGTLVQGKGVEWLFTGSNNHTVTDSSGMGLFDSGTKAPGATYLFAFVAAGIYNYKDTLHPTMTGTLRIPLTVSPLSGGLSTRFAITSASGAGPPGYVFDVQIQRPGSSTWVNLLSNQTALSATFIPDGGVGTYSFRSRIRNTANAMSSWYSMTVAITVS